MLKETLKQISAIDKNSYKEAWKYLDGLSKPIKSLGKLEDIAARYAGITGKVCNEVHKKNIIIMCSDNGICDENVSGCSQEVTAIVTNNLPTYTTGVGVLSKFSNSDITVIDIGVMTDIENKNVINKKIRYGTANMSKGPAMTREECIQAIEVGIEKVDELVKEGYDLFGTGEMGIGNTSTSAAIISVLLSKPVKDVTGNGSGLKEGQLEQKINAISKSIEVNKPDKNDVIDVMSKVGGLDIAGLCGCFLGAAKNRVPIVIDGIISAAAALCAYKLCSYTKDFMFASHDSEEKGMAYALRDMGLEAMLNLNMRLGEGSGCPLAFNIIEASLYTMKNMISFTGAGISEEEVKNYEGLYAESYGSN